MIQSMTGFGIGTAENTQWQCRIELRSVNSRYHEVRVHGLRNRIALEHALQALVKKAFPRGKFDMVCFQEPCKTAANPGLDEKAFIAHAKALQTLASKSKLSQDISVATVLKTMPTQLSQGESGQPLQTLFMQAAKKACEALGDSRTKEGQVLMEDIFFRVDVLAGLCKKIEKRTKTFLQQKKKDLHKRIVEWTDGTVSMDADRLTLEIAVLIEKSDVTEEIVRLGAHLKSIQKMHKKTNVDQGLGRELDFILQEINREINTIGSKMHDPQAAQAVIAMKQEAEKIREQAQNIQ